MKKAQFDNLKKNQVVYIAKDNDWLKTNSVFTVLGLKSKMNDLLNPYFDKENFIEFMFKTKEEIINMVELGNPQKRMPVNGNHMDAN